MAPGQRARLIFALDATASRQPTWDMACRLQVEMFQEAAKIGGLQIQLAHYGGNEFEASDWISDGRALADKMGEIDCCSGNTQIEKVLNHALHETARRKVQATVFVGDAMEEDPASLFAIARELGRHGMPVFLFQEGDDPKVSQTFGEIACRTRGAHCHFTAGAARELVELLRAVAAYAAGGREALLANTTAASANLLLQLPPR